MNDAIGSTVSTLFYFALIFLGLNIADYFDSLLAKNLVIATAIAICGYYIYDWFKTTFIYEVRRPSLIVAQALSLILLTALMIGFEPELFAMPSNWYRTTPLTEMTTYQSSGIFENYQWYVWLCIAVTASMIFTLSVLITTYIAFASKLDWPLPHEWDRSSINTRVIERSQVNPYRLQEENRDLRQQIADLQQKLSDQFERYERSEKENAALVSHRAQDKTDRECDRMKLTQLSEALDQARKDIERLKQENNRLKRDRKNVTANSPEDLPPGYSIRPDEHPLKASKKKT